MTCEVALMNRIAVVLAADSATTVTYWENGIKQQRYFKGANKVFNISSKHPVGAMIYDSADFQGAPWEVIIKAYRDARSDKSHDYLKDYPGDLFDFISTNGHLFSAANQDAQFVSRVLDAAGRVCLVTIGSPDEDGDLNDVAEMRESFDSLKETITNADYLDDITDEFVNQHAIPRLAELTEQISHTSQYSIISDAIQAEEVAKLAITAVFKKYWTTMPTTGMVFSGYGDKEYFPALAHFSCYGLLFGKLIHERVGDLVSVGYDNVSAIIPLAQCRMVKTFMYGTSSEVLGKLDKLINSTLERFIDKLVEANLVADRNAVAPHKTAVHESFDSDLTKYLWKSHTQPLKDVIDMLSVPELSDLAETLVSIESLKERVTRPSESVSGPIDVAAISKSDGFIWIKRKHYFDRDMNYRYFARKGL